MLNRKTARLSGILVLGRPFAQCGSLQIDKDLKHFLQPMPGPIQNNLCLFQDTQITLGAAMSIEGVGIGGLLERRCPQGMVCPTKYRSGLTLNPLAEDRITDLPSFHWPNCTTHPKTRPNKARLPALGLRYACRVAGS